MFYIMDLLKLNRMDNICVLLSLFLILPNIEATCRYKNGVYSFGDKCGFMCHCKRNTKCNETTGECSNGCARGWYGPGCQYRDIIEQKYAKLTDNSYNISATDGETKTCSRDVKSNRTEQLLWSVELSNNETIHEIQISTKAKSLVYFKNFTVLVGYSPSSTNYDTVDERACFRQGHDIPKSSTFIVLCKQPVIGNVVKIKLAQSQNVLELCDVRINGGRNLAFKRTSSQSSKSERCGSDFCKSSFAVDGYASTHDMYFCSLTDEEENPWWKIYIDYKIRIWNVEIIDTNNHKQIPYVVHITKTNDTKIGTEVLYWTKGVSDKTHTQSITMNSVGKFVTISVEGKHRLTLCEVFVYGDCKKNRCGYNCEKKCQCNHATIWDKLSGNCAISCVQKEKGYQCNMPCKKDDDCNFKCGENCFRGDCNPKSGECTQGCKPGWDGTFCKNKCGSGTFGEKCQEKCSTTCKNGVCGHLYGGCSNGCKPGYHGNKCEQKCQDGKFGEECKENCPSNCNNNMCDHVTGNCSIGCKPGYKGNTCAETCDAGFYGRNCEGTCSENCEGGNTNCDPTSGHCKNGCKPGWIEQQCTRACPPRKFGAGCKEDCASTCKKDVCNHVNGSCSGVCKPGYRGNKCESECQTGTFGVECKENCSLNCKTGVCNHVNGNCSEGCNPGYRGKMCEEECNNGYYGDKCAAQCNAHCKEGNTICRHTDGECLNGCQAGWNGKKCDSQCSTGKFGIGCKESCPSNCKHDVCGYVDGDCDEGCKLGFQGEKCKENCTSGTFGDYCNTKCSDYCEGGDKMCRPTDGQCLNGCKAGWNGTDCFSKCDIGFYGKNCAFVCGNCQLGNRCDHVTGTCQGGCKTGYSGATCLQAMQKSNISNSIVAGGVAVLVILILIGVIAFVWHKQRNQNKRKDEQRGDVELRDAVATASNENRRPSHGGNTQSNTADDSGSAAAAAGDANIYNNFPMQSLTRNAIPLSNLLPYVKENLANPDHFATEFQDIPYGMKKSSAVAKKSFNRGKNRYKDMHAYDETRVKLKKLPNIQGSDYINASSITGHHKEYAYIAAQGPIDSSMDDFWRMIWEKDIYTIAMVTNLVELEKTKCQQYWPAVETSTRYGNVFVNTASEVIYYDFTVRNFNVSFEAGPQRNIRQFHFTSWPDKSVPKRPSSLIQFWRKVRRNDENKDHTWLVHCSAGVGRTGTFIALDILYDQGKDKGSVDVYQCVKDLRDQRVNMVQTKEQYVYLHGLMVEALLLFSEPVQLDNIHKIVRDLKTVDQASKKTKMLLQYEALKTDMTLLRTEKEVKEMYSAALLKENSSKNRSINVLPPNDFRPFLITNIPGCTNYINAVLTPSYCHSHGCYVTQKPLENTAVDYCRLLYEMNVKVIVKFPDNEKNHVEPDMSIGPFTLKKVSEEDKVFYTMTVFNMAYSSKNKKITQLEFKNWNTDQITPTGPENMLHFLQEVERLNRIAADSPLLVQCLDGSEKSGLFITLMNIFERVRLDKEVCIPQVIRELRYIRQQFIPNFEQFQFCYNAVLCYVDSHQMYANM